MTETEATVQYWHEIAVTLADYCAATAEGLLSVKRTSAYERKRQRNICKFAADALESKVSTQRGIRRIEVGRVIERCRRNGAEPCDSL